MPLSRLGSHCAHRKLTLLCHLQKTYPATGRSTLRRLDAVWRFVLSALLTQCFSDNLIALLGAPGLGLAISPSWQGSPPIYGHFTLTYPVFRICWDATIFLLRNPGWIHVSKPRHLPRDPSKLRQLLHRSRSQRCNFSCIPSLATLSAQPTSGSAFAPASKTTSAASCMRVGDLEPGTPLLPVHKCIN